MSPEQKPPLRERVESFVYSSPVEIVVYTLIVLSVGMIAIEVGFPEWAKQHEALFEESEDFFIIFFSIEYFTKLILSKQKWVFFRQHIIDLLAILPFIRFVGLFRGLRILRILRVVRLMRLGNLIMRQLNALDGIQNIREIVIILVVFACTVLSGTTGIIMFERNTPDTHFHTLGDGLWWCFVTITTVGYGDMYPQTTEGKILGGVIMLIGLSFYGLVAGLGSNFIINHFKKSSEWIISTFNHHVIVIGVNDKTANIIEKLIELEQRVVLITDDMTKAPHHPENKLVVLEGDFTSQSMLQKAGIEEAAHAIILTDNQHQTLEMPETSAILSTLSIERINRHINTIAEASSEDAAFHLENAGADIIVQSKDFTADILAFSTEHPNYVKSTQNLLRKIAHRRIEDETTVPEAHIGQPLKAIQRHFLRNKKLVLGIKREGQTLNQGDITLHSEDRLIIADLTQERPQ